MNKILITGGAGFIGSNLIKRLIKNEEVEIYALDNFNDFYSRLIKEKNLNEVIDNHRFKFIEGDLFDEKILAQLGDVNSIVHLAALPGVRNSIQKSLEYQYVNTTGTNVLLEFARKNNIKKFILASSSSIYGNNENMPWKETEYPNPISPYASSKIAAEMIGQTFSHLYNMQFIALRFFTVYGPAQRPDLAINSFFDCIYHKKPIKIFGDGTASRDYTYIDDIVSGIIAAIGCNIETFEVLNMGTKNKTSINDLILLIQEICERDAIIEYLPARIGEVQATLADITKAQFILNYDPQIGIREGLVKYNEWFKNNMLH